MNLKSVRESLQEVVEDDATGKGSASRMTLITTNLTLCLGLVAAIAATVYNVRDCSATIASLILALAGSGAGPYTAKRVVEAFKGSPQASLPPQEQP